MIHGAFHTCFTFIYLFYFIYYDSCIAHRFSELNSDALGSIGGAGHTGAIKWPPAGSPCPKTGNLPKTRLKAFITPAPPSPFTVITQHNADTHFTVPRRAEG